MNRMNFTETTLSILDGMKIVDLEEYLGGRKASAASLLRSRIEELQAQLRELGTEEPESVNPSLVRRIRKQNLLSGTAKVRAELQLRPLSLDEARDIAGHGNPASIFMTLSNIGASRGSDGLYRLGIL